LENSIYCSPDKLNLVVGSSSKNGVYVDDFKQIPLPEGAMINGIITNVDIMTDFLDTIAKEYHLQENPSGENNLLKNPSSIVIQASNIVTKIIEVPASDETQMREFIRREFSQYEDVSIAEQTALYDYTVLNQIGPNGGVEVLAASSGREMIEDYRRAFDQACYNIVQIGIASEALIKLVSLLPNLNGQTYMLAQIEANRQTNIIFIEGTFRISSGYRLVGEVGSDGWINEIGQNLASTLQFIRAQRGQSELSQIHIAGTSLKVLSILQADYSYLNVRMERFDLSQVVTVSEKIAAERLFDPGTLLFNLGALVKRV